jgi:hypothetical protein
MQHSSAAISRVRFSGVSASLDLPPLGALAV